MLYITASANLSENIRSVNIRDTEKQPNEYTFQLVCTGCRETHDSPIRINRFERHRVHGSRGEASFMMKCKFCGKECTIILDRFEEMLYNSDDERNKEFIEKAKINRKKVGIKSIDNSTAIWLKVDCRGCEITKFEIADTELDVTLTSGKKIICAFDEGENEWYDYDDMTSEEVYITNVTFDIIKGT